MENRQKHRLNRAMTAFALLLALTFLTACNDDDAPLDSSPYTISGDADGNQVVPSVSSAGTGTIAGTYDPATRQLEYTSTWNGLTGPPIGGGFYHGAAGINGPAIGNPWAFDAGATTAGGQAGTIRLTEEQAEQLTKGTVYYSYGTAENPNGEIRGQITAVR